MKKLLTILFALILTASFSQSTITPGKNGGTGVANTNKRLYFGDTIKTIGTYTNTFLFPSSSKTWRLPDTTGDRLALLHYTLPRSGTISGYPMTGGILFDNSTSGKLEFIWQSSAGSSGYMVGMGDGVDFASSTKFSYAHFNERSLEIETSDNNTGYDADITIETQSLRKGFAGIGIYNGTYGVNFSMQGVTGVSSVAQAQMISDDPNFTGITYDSNTQTAVQAHSVSGTLVHKALGNLLWAPISYTAAATSATSPLSLSSNNLSISQATTSTPGYLSSADWNTFNNKASSSATYTLNGATGALGSASTGTFTAGSTGSGFTLNFGTSTQNGKIALANGGTNADLSATGGTSQILKQASAGAAITVGQLAASDLSNSTTGTGSVVLASSPTLTTPNVGAATASSLSITGITDGQIVCTTTGGALYGSSTFTRNATSGAVAIQTSSILTALSVDARSNGATIQLSQSGTSRGFLGCGNGFPLTVWNANASAIVANFNNTGGLFLGASTSATALLHLKAGTATANTAPIKFTSGTLLTTPEAGTMEYDGTDFYLTPSSATRYWIARVITNTATLDFPNTLAQTQSDLTMTVTGAAVGDVVCLGVPNGSLTAKCEAYFAWVSSANTVTVRFNNMGVAADDPASGTFKATIIKN